VTDARRSTPLLALAALTFTALAAMPVAAQRQCPANAIRLAAGSDLQAAVDRAPAGVSFCLGGGTHRLQTLRPKEAQKFFGEDGALLNGSRLLTQFRRIGALWVVDAVDPASPGNGRCLPDSARCDPPDAVFIDDAPLKPAVNLDSLTPGAFYVDRAARRLYLADAPEGRRVEFAARAGAFGGTARGVLIDGLTIEKYASPAQFGAIDAHKAEAWTIRNCVIRLNSGAGIGAGTGTTVTGTKIHHNGQIGVTGVGTHITIEDSEIWANNTRGFDYTWEAGGVKLALSRDVVFRRNYVYDNVGPGLWCDIECRHVLYEANRVERNLDAGIFHEISFEAVIRDNVLRHNGTADRPWYWGADILIAASRDVMIQGNVVHSGLKRCGIMLIDQSRPNQDGGRYETRNVLISGNDLTFDGHGCAGGASDAPEGDPNELIIENGGNVFSNNTYRIPQERGSFSFSWGHRSFDWEEIKRRGIEEGGRLVRY
jgi:hypothetical protein